MIHNSEIIETTQNIYDQNNRWNIRKRRVTFKKIISITVKFFIL